MKARLKVESNWLQLERKSMHKMRREYEKWESDTLQKAKEATDLRALRDVFYELGDRWEWNQTTGAWLADAVPLDTIGLILRVPGFQPNKERYILYGIMAYSKGITQKFDHLGDKERIIIERDTQTGRMLCWSSTGHGAMDMLPTEVSMFTSIEDILANCFIVAQPGDHALRLEIPPEKRHPLDMTQRLWELATGGLSYQAKEIVVLTSADLEDALDFKFHRYAKAVVELERKWKDLEGSVFGKAKEAVLDRIPDHLETKMKGVLRCIEGLLHVLWFKPPAFGLEPAREVYNELQAEPTPTSVESTLLPLLGELVYSLADVIEKSKYIKWKSVLDKQEYSRSDVFQGLQLSDLAKEAFAAALQDILEEHPLSYIGYPERGTMKQKIMRVLLGCIVLPARLASTFMKSVRSRLSYFKKIVTRETPGAGQHENQSVEEAA
jgi:hypothetical protein